MAEPHFLLHNHGHQFVLDRIVMCVLTLPQLAGSLSAAYAGLLTNRALEAAERRPITVKEKQHNPYSD